MLLIVGEPAENPLAPGRGDSLWRALAEVTETWRLDLVDQVSASRIGGDRGPRQSYRELVGQVREVIDTCVPADATVLVVSKGDEDLVDLHSRRGWHFPQIDAGEYAGAYPANAALAIEQLEDLRSRGAEYLVFPKTAFWWLDHYEGFREHLESDYSTVLRDQTCIIFDLRSRRGEERLDGGDSWTHAAPTDVPPPDAPPSRATTSVRPTGSSVPVTTMSPPDSSTGLRRREARRANCEVELAAVLAESGADCVVLADEDVCTLVQGNRLSGRRVIAAPPRVTGATAAALSQVAEKLSEIWVRSPAEKSMLVRAGLTPKTVLIADSFPRTAAIDKPDAPDVIAVPAEPVTSAAASPDSTRPAREVAAALGLTPPSDPLETGLRVARNLDIGVLVDSASFHPWTRLYRLDIDLFGSVTPGDVSGYFETAAGEAGLVNASVIVSPGRGLPARLHATAALTEDVTPESVTVVVTAWGWPVARIAPSGTIIEERAGLIGMNRQSPGKVAVDYWGDPGETRIQLGTKTVAAEPVFTRSDGPATYRVTSDFPFDRQTLTVLSETGRGQAFTSFAAYTAPRRLTSLRLQAMKGAHAGQSAWLIGNGPSVRVEDLDRLADAGQPCFSFNRFYLAHDDTRLRPTFTVTGDQQMIEDFGREIVERSGGQVFVAHDRPPELAGDYIWVRQINVFPSLFSRDAARWVTPGGASLYVAMQIGYYLGIRRWYVYGADFTFRFKRNSGTTDVFHAASGDGNHFIRDYRSGRTWCPPSIENILPSFYAARQLMESEGGFIRNATRGGALEVFERIDFDEALKVA